MYLIYVNVNQTPMNIVAILVGTLIAYAGGALWYSVLFQKQWMKVTGMTNMSPEQKNSMQKAAMPLYVMQLLITVVQVSVLDYFMRVGDLPGLHTALLMLVGFVWPTLIGSVIWSGKSREATRLMIMVQGGYQLLTFVILGLVLALWK